MESFYGGEGLIDEFAPVGVVQRGRSGSVRGESGLRAARKPGRRHAADRNRSRGVEPSRRDREEVPESRVAWRDAQRFSRRRRSRGLILARKTRASPPAPMAARSR